MIIGILGQMRTGKSTLARSIVQTYGWRFSDGVSIASFAEPLRMECAQMLWADQKAEVARQWWATCEEQYKSEMRPLLQALGQAKRRFVNPDYWVNALAESIKTEHISSESEDCLVVIDDVRHENEARWILESGGIIIRLSADRETLIERGASEERLAHYSETAMISRSAVEKEYAHRCLHMNTSGLSSIGVLKGLRRFVDDMLWGEEE